MIKNIEILWYFFIYVRSINKIFRLKWQNNMLRLKIKFEKDDVIRYKDIEILWKIIYDSILKKPVHKIMEKLLQLTQLSLIQTIILNLFDA